MAKRVPLLTKSLELHPHKPENILALIDGAEAYERSFGFPPAEGLRDFLVSGDVSPDFLARLRAVSGADPWTFGFAVVHAVDRKVIGMVGFKGPPGTPGIVEIAYSVVPQYEGQGFASEAAQALVGYAFADPRVRMIRAHTLPENNASTTVLAKLGFERVGEVEDPEDGPVWRWEKPRETSSVSG